MMKVLDRKEMIGRLKVACPGLWMKFSEEFDGVDGGIWTTSESEAVHTATGLKPFDYYAEGPLYDLGVLVAVVELLDQHGWFAEWHDPGTMMLWRK